MKRTASEDLIANLRDTDSPEAKEIKVQNNKANTLSTTLDGERTHENRLYQDRHVPVRGVIEGDIVHLKNELLAHFWGLSDDQATDLLLEVFPDRVRAAYTRLKEMDPKQEVAQNNETVGAYSLASLHKLIAMLSYEQTCDLLAKFRANDQRPRC